VESALCFASRNGKQRKGHLGACVHVARGRPRFLPRLSRTGSTGAMRVGTAAGVGQKFQNGRAARPAIPTPLCSRNARLSICLIWSFTRVPSSRTFSVQGDVASARPGAGSRDLVSPGRKIRYRERAISIVVRVFVSPLARIFDGYARTRNASVGGGNSARQSRRGDLGI
jgi:hypothetical protein